MAALASAVVLAACGGGSGSGGGRTTPYGPASSPYAMSKCMRENGLPHFPDPSAGPGGGVGFQGVGFSINGSIVVDGITFTGPAATQAEQACKAFLPPAGGPHVTASQKAAAVRNAECMRRNGVPNFPDPTFGSGKGPDLSQLNPQSPAFQHAAKACGDEVGKGGFSFRIG